VGFRRLIARNLRTWEEFCSACIRLAEIAAANTLERYQLQYGDEEGQIQYDLHRPRGVSLKILIERYGKSEGQRRFTAYRKRQGESNTFEYKNRRFGWTKKEFDEFNRSRSCTLANFISRHGDVIGRKMWEDYRSRQAYTNSEEHLGTERYRSINRQKSHTLPVYIERYGEENGTDRYYAYINSQRSFYSKKSFALFSRLANTKLFEDSRMFYGENEYGVWCDVKNCLFKYDFVSLKYKFAIEFNGDHYHGNPSLYKPSDKLRGRGCTNLTAREKWAADDFKNNYLFISRKFPVIMIWERDWDRNPAECIERILDYVRTRV